MDNKSDNGGSNGSGSGVPKGDTGNRGAKSGGGSGSGMMVAPGTGGAAQIPRDTFESNPKGYYSDLNCSGNIKK